MSEIEPKTFALVHGFCHDKWHWRLLQSELHALGQNTITFDLPLSDPSKNFDDYGSIIANELESHENVVGVFHSRAGNYGPRAVNKLQRSSPGAFAVERMVFLSSSLEPDTLHALGRPLENENVPPRNSSESRKTIIACPDLGKDMRMIDPSLAEEFLYHDIEDQDLVDEAIRHLTPQNRPSVEPKLESWPNVPQSYIICEDDRMVSPTWSEYVAREWLQIEPVKIPGGHSPFLSRPRLLAQKLIEIASTDK